MEVNRWPSIQATNNNASEQEARGSRETAGSREADCGRKDYSEKDAAGRGGG